MVGEVDVQLWLSYRVYATLYNWAVVLPWPTREN